MLSKVIKGKTIEVVEGNIVTQPDLECIVNAANRWLAPGGGVAGAIHSVAGPKLYEECKKYAPIDVGQAVITGGYNLPNKYVIHTLGPVYGKDKPEDELLRKCYVNSLKLADEKGISSIGFPAISTGIFGYPLEEGAQVALKAVYDTLDELKNVRLIRFVLFGQKAYEISEKELSKLPTF